MQGRETKSVTEVALLLAMRALLSELADDRRTRDVVRKAKTVALASLPGAVSNATAVGTAFESNAKAVHAVIELIFGEVPAAPMPKPQPRPRSSIRPGDVISPANSIAPPMTVMSPVHRSTPTRSSSPAMQPIPARWRRNSPVGSPRARHVRLHPHTRRLNRGRPAVRAPA